MGVTFSIYSKDLLIFFSSIKPVFQKKNYKKLTENINNILVIILGNLRETSSFSEANWID